MMDGKEKMMHRSRIQKNGVKDSLMGGNGCPQAENTQSGIPGFVPSPSPPAVCGGVGVGWEVGSSFSSMTMEKE